MITSHETESDYTSFFSSLKEISKLENLELKPKWIAIDACNASANEIKIFFPDCQIVMCYFHLKYNTRKRKSLLGHRYIQVIRHITSLHNTKSKLEFQQKYKLSSKIINYEYQEIKLVTTKLINSAKKLEIVNFRKFDEKIYDYNHKSGKISSADLNKEWCSCNEFFDYAMCSHLVKIALLENYLLPGMKLKSKSLRIRHREKIKVSEEMNSSCSDLGEQLQQAEYIGT